MPVDGGVRAATSEIDPSRLTGEPLPAELAPATSVGRHDQPHRRARRAGRHGWSDTLSGRLAALVEDAAFAKSHSQRLADAVAGVFVPVVLAIAAATC